MTTLAGTTMLMSGGSRGIGLAIAKRAAQDGANVVLLAKTDQPDPRLHGTIHTAAAEIEAAGGQALAVVGDVRDDDAIQRAVDAAVERFGGIDIVVNNASVLVLKPTIEVTPKQYDLMQDVGLRGTFMLSRAALPHLLEAPNPHILTLSPPLNLTSEWVARYPSYALEKYGMSLATVGLAGEFRGRVGVNSLWPRTAIATDAIGNILGAEMMQRTRTPEIVADAAYAILTKPAATFTGQHLIDDDVLIAEGVTDLDRYAAGDPSLPLQPDFFLD